MISQTNPNRKKGRGEKPTDPLQILPMPRPHLILQHGQQIPQHLQPLRQQPDPLVHLEITPHSAVHGLQLRLRPHEFRAIEHAPLQMYVNPQNEQLTNLLRNLLPTQRDPARQRQLLRQRVGRRDGGAEQILEEARLDALGQRVADGQLGHVVLLLAQGDEVVVDARLVLARVVEVEVLRLDVRRGEGLPRRELGDVGEEARFVRGRHAPDDDGAVVEEEDLGDVDPRVEVEGALFSGVVVVGGDFGRVDVVGEGVGAPGIEACVAGGGVEVEEFFAAVVGGFFDFEGAVGVPAFAGRASVYRSGFEDGGADVVVGRGIAYLRAIIAVGRIDAFVELLWICASSSCSAFEELHNPF